MQTPIKLYDMELSGNCYKVRLFCSILDIAYESIPLNLFAGEHKQADYLQINPRGQLPSIDDNGTIVWDSAAILVYLAKKYASPHWLPLDAESLAMVMQWLAVSENEILYGMARARAVKLFNRPWDLAECQAIGTTGLAILEKHLQQRQWLATGQTTIADIACYPYVALAPEGDISLAESPNVLAWIKRIQELPGYITMPGL